MEINEYRKKCIGDQVLTDEEIRKIWETLQRIGDSDGFISKTELRRILARLKVRADDDTIDTFFDRIDKDDDRQISFDEFTAFARIREDQLVCAFHEVDTNKDGHLELDEVVACLETHGLSASKRSVREFIDRLDSDRSGTLSYSEFRELAMLFPHVGVASIFSIGTAAQVIGYYAVPKHDHKHKNPLVVLASGGVAGLVSRTCTAPADRIKVMMQAGNGSSVAGIARNIIRTDGVAGLWSGNLANVLKIIPESATKFFAFETFKDLIARDKDDITIYERLIAGSSAGVVAQTAIYPFEIVKTRLAVAPSGTYSSIANAFSSIVAKEGMGGLYAGLRPSLLGIIPYAGIDLAVYSTVKDAWIRQHSNETPSDLVILSMGTVSSFCGQVVAYPLQLLRTKMQIQQFDNMGECCRRVLSKDGPRGFYRGIGANFMKGIPAVGIGYVAYERSRRFFESRV